jgi:hypothetical protein
MHKSHATDASRWNFLWKFVRAASSVQRGRQSDSLSILQTMWPCAKCVRLRF